MKEQIGRNLQTLRRCSRLSQEALAERVGVSRQTVAKWENGESAPDLAACAALAEVFGVTLDSLVYHDEGNTGIAVPPRGKHLFGLVSVGERGQIVIPKEAREVFSIRPGDKLLVFGDESQGIALMKAEHMLGFIQQFQRLREEEAP